MASARIDDALLSYDLTGDGPRPLVLVHGAWVSGRSFDPIVPGLSASFRVLRYDRRGHGDSRRPPGTASLTRHAADLAALLEHLGAAPAWVAGNSSGAVVALRLASTRPDLCRGLMLHEPPLFSLLRDDPASAGWLERIDRCLATVVEQIEAGHHEAAARLFMETVSHGPGSWAPLSPNARRAVAAHAAAFLDEASGPERLAFDLSPMRTFPHPVLLTQGGHSPPVFARVIARLKAWVPHASLHTFEAAGHVPHRTHPLEFVAAVTRFAAEHEAPIP